MHDTNIVMQYIVTVIRITMDHIWGNEKILRTLFMDVASADFYVLLLLWARFAEYNTDLK